MSQIFRWDPLPVSNGGPVVTKVFTIITTKCDELDDHFRICDEREDFCEEFFDDRECVCDEPEDFCEDQTMLKTSSGRR